ncbi:MAG: ROK family protein [Eubacteriales bacterium]|nr:ROK family protein [Eubacteriales bacterium]
MTRYRVGIDIGGTKVELGLLTGDGRILQSNVIPTPSLTEGTDAFVKSICGAFHTLLTQSGVVPSQIEGFGVGVPGTADWKKGIVRYCPNLFGAVQLPMADMFERQLGIRPFIMQDSWAAAYAEYEFGRKKQTPNMLCVTVGTGIGCGVILNGQVFGGALGTAGELGHVPIVFEGRPCSCGRRGCLERYVSGTAIFTQAMERFPEKLRGLPPKTESVFTLAYAGERDALALIAECVDKLAYGLSLAIDLLAVDTVVISGGVSAHKALLIDPLEEKIRTYAYPPWAKSDRLQVLQAALGSEAPMVGAAFLTEDQIC